MKLAGQLALVAVVAVIVQILFLREPGFGDDLTYWSFAFDLHERGLEAWQQSSFHDLRWPVWGVCLAVQKVVGIGVASYYAEPIFYLILGSLLAFGFARQLFESFAAGWAAALAFLFHPLLDTVCFRPMPDLSEGVLGAAAMMFWWRMMKAEGAGVTLAYSVLTGLSVFIVESNRVTGAFIVPVLIVCTLVSFPRRFGWLVGAGVVAALCYGGEMWFYHRLFDDWFHNLHANLGNAGNKGTEPIPLWFLPLRFFDTLWNGNQLAPFYCVLAFIGLVPMWKRHGQLGRSIVLWFGILHFEYSCAPQPGWPIRPMIRDADRFLCGEVIPFSLLAVAGLWTLANLRPVRECWRWVSYRHRPPAWAVVAVAGVLLWFGTTRERFNPGFIPEFRDYLRTLAPGTRVFTHDAMRALAFLCDSKRASSLEWFAPRTSILQREKPLEQAAKRADEFWYARKLVWLSTRKRLERGKLADQPRLASYFEAPESDWALTLMLAKGDQPDLIFYRRRSAQMPPPLVLEANAPEFDGLVPKLPVTWNPKRSERHDVRWNIPPTLRGMLGRFELTAASEAVEAFTVRLKFHEGKTMLSEYLLKPYLHSESGKEFFILPIPANSDYCEVQLRAARKTAPVEFMDFRVVLDPPPAARN